MSSRNRRHVDEIPEEIRNELSFVFVDDVSEVLREALVDAQPPPPETHAAPEVQTTA